MGARFTLSPADLLAVPGTIVVSPEGREDVRERVQTRKKIGNSVVQSWTEGRFSFGRRDGSGATSQRQLWDLFSAQNASEMGDQNQMKASAKRKASRFGRSIVLPADRGAEPSHVLLFMSECSRGVFDFSLSSGSAIVFTVSYKQGPSSRAVLFSQGVLLHVLLCTTCNTPAESKMMKNGSLAVAIVHRQVVVVKGNDPNPNFASVHPADFIASQPSVHTRNATACSTSAPSLPSETVSSSPRTSRTPGFLLPISSPPSHSGTLPRRRPRRNRSPSPPPPPPKL